MTTQPLYDVNEQTGIDMSNARASSTVAVENVRDFLHRKFGSYYPPPLLTYFHHL